MEAGSEVIKKELNRVFEEQHINSSLFDFYKRICGGRYRYVIIVPRKCLTEYKCVRQADAELDVKKDTVLMTTKGFARYQKQIEEELRKNEELPDNYLAIADDIMIYGRGINRFMNHMFESFHSDELAEKLIKKTYLEIFIESSFEFQFDDKYQEILDERYNCSFSYRQYSAVKRASDLFLKSFYATATPNTSFIRSWYLSNDIGQKWLKIGDKGIILGDDIKTIRDLELVNIEQNAAQRAERFHLGIINLKDDTFLGNLCEFRCVRCYYNENLERIVLVPYVFMKPLKITEIDELLERVSKLFGEAISADKNDLLTRADGNIDYSILKYEYLTQIVSDIYGLYIWNKFADALSSEEKKKDLFKDDKYILQYSFGEQNVYHLKELSEKLGESLQKVVEEAIGNYHVEESPIYFSQEETEAQKIIDQILNDAMGIPTNGIQEKSRWFVDEYFDRSGKGDEVRANEKEDKIFGISTESFSKKFSELVNGEAEYSVNLYKEIIRCMDSGIAGLTVKSYKIDEDIIYITSVLNAGEQSYRIKLDPYMLLFEYFKKIEQDCKNLHMYSSLEERIDNFVQNVLESEDGDKANQMVKDINYLRTAIQDQKISYSNMFVDRMEYEEDVKKRQKYEEIYHKIMR